MASEICVPRLGWNMEEGTFVGWLKEDGEAVRVGDPLFSFEGEKAAQDIESIDEGILRIAPGAPQPGDTVPVGAVIGLLLRPGEEMVAPLPSAPHKPAAQDHTPVASSSVTVSQPPTPARGRLRSTPLARRIARELGVDWTTLRGSGSSGRIRKVDVLAAAPTASNGNRPVSITATPARSVPVSPMRRTIAARMIESRQATAPVTLTSTVDATNLVNLRGQFRAVAPGGQAVPSYTDFLVKLTALALRDHPLLNARWAGDRIEFADAADIGIAVDTEAGLLVPVLRGAADLGLRAIAERSGDLIRRARDGTIRASELAGGTFTVTNLGSFGIESFTPIINYPECAILGLGRIARQPTMIGDRVEGRDRLSLSLTFDHRIVDGAPAARFLQALGRLIENPGPSLLS